MTWQEEVAAIPEERLASDPQLRRLVAEGNHLMTKLDRAVYSKVSMERERDHAKDQLKDVRERLDQLQNPRRSVVYSKNKMDITFESPLKSDSMYSSEWTLAQLEDVLSQMRMSGADDSSIVEVRSGSMKVYVKDTGLAPMPLPWRNPTPAENPRRWSLQRVALFGVTGVYASSLIMWVVSLFV